MNEQNHQWRPNWYATRLHAIGENDKPEGMRSVRALCGAWTFEGDQTEWSKRKMENGVDKCKRCLRMIGEGVAA